VEVTTPTRLIGAVLAVMALAPAATATAADGPPRVLTYAATATRDTGAQLNGWVDANGRDTDVVFDYGTTPSYGQSAAVGTVPHDRSATVARVASGLTPGTTYHVRVRAANSKGTTLGFDQTFTTTGTAPVQPAPTAPAPAPAAPALPGTPAPAVLTPAPPKPVEGTSVVVAPTGGTVLVKAPDGSGFRPLTAGSAVPVGSTVDARTGAISLTSSVGAGTQTGTFRGGMFQIRQSAGANGMTDIVLRGGDFSGCRRAHSAATRRTPPVRRLWGSDSGGRFATHGRNSVATVRGTAWVTTETCAGTRTTVTQGAVSVRDLHRRRTVLVRAGASYLAR
jgi:hypothetical protein